MDRPCLTDPVKTAPLKIFIDATIVKPTLGGIATYVAGVVQGFAAQPEVSICVATSNAERLTLADNIDVVTLPSSVQGFGRRLIWRERELPRLLRKHRADVLFAPTIELSIRRLDVPSIMVIHDLGPLQAPGLYGWKRWLRYAIGVYPACHRANHVVCVSNATLVQLRGAFGYLRTPCSVVGEAGRTLPYAARAARTPPYVLAVGAILEHKNIHTLVQAMNHPSLADLELHLAGPMDATEQLLFEGWRSQVQRPERIIHHGFVDLQKLAELYAEATAVALPSLSEGFGLPMLEAMRAGVPVVASSIPALREVGGSAALYVDEPLTPEAWAEALGSVLFDPVRAATMERASRDRVENISWEDIGTQLTKLAHAVISG